MQVEAWLQRAAGSAPTRIALQAPDGHMSYAELLSAARNAAKRLLELGARPGERVAIALPPGIDFAEALHACFLLGAIAVPVDLRLTSSERERILAAADVVVEERLVHSSEMRSESENRSGSASIASEATTHDRDAVRALEATTHDLDAVCAVIHTSGTTSSPRPIELTYGNFLWSALGSAAALGVEADERWLCALPLSHVGGLSILVRSSIYATTAVIHERFETDRVLAALRDDRISLVSLVSTTLARLLDAGLRDPPRLRCALTGGGPVPDALVQRAYDAGVRVVETYGLTECCSQAVTAPLATIEDAGSVGTGGEGTESVDTGREGTRREGTGGERRGGERRAREGTGGEGGRRPARHIGAGVPLFCTRTEIAPDGEILLSGPTIARNSLAEDGRLHTGDLGSLDSEGFLRVTGRKADTIVSGGENVAPSEVEAVLESCPGVLEAAVVGRSDPQWGEAVTAIVVTAPRTSVGESAVRAHCAARLAPFKVPKRVELVTAPLPRTRSGKLLRREL